MRIEHVGLWTKELEKSKEFYTQYFSAAAGNKYHNLKSNFQSYFLTFSSGARLEIMWKPDTETNNSREEIRGYSHLAFSAGSEAAVDELTNRLKQNGFKIVSGPRHTGDGYYESCVLDPDGNKVEITV